ncbi:RbsD/FucU domain-containing protein [Streptomyces sp. W16]|uniref:RbsD/FucU family protein n=1 Tax=Streptomyces sp. W16 TaxID=3076631 RepID=UPI00295B6855|nr:RbsD/FucU domain-containing protein [Streptomyces sp. W16]MDV9169336.1 RbsD/FucU domain-containing protein [Streptomyces sp. W16]
MLKGLNPLLTPDLLHALAAMGHGDTIAIVDRNFPAYSLSDRVIHLAAADVVETGEAVFSLLPLDTFVPSPLARMEIVGDPDTIPDVQAEFIRAASRSADRSLDVEPIERHAFYSRTKGAFAVVQTGETRPYGCFLAVKGVLPEPVHPPESSTGPSTTTPYRS